MLKIYLMGLAITMLFVGFSLKLADEKLDADDAKYLLFFTIFWFIALPVTLIRVVLRINKDDGGVENGNLDER